MAAVTAGVDIAGRAKRLRDARGGVDGNDLHAVHAAAHRGRRTRPRRRRPDAARVPHVPPRRPLEGRSGEVPAEGRGRAWLAAILCRRTRESRRADGCSEARPSAGRAADHRAARPRCAAAKAAPYPDPATSGDGDRGEPTNGRASASSFRDAIREALAAELERDHSASSSSARTSPPWRRLRVTPGLFDRFGPDRVFDTPISETGPRGRRLRRCGHRPASCVRGHVRRLHGPADRLARQPGLEVLVHQQRAGRRCRPPPPEPAWRGERVGGVPLPT